METNNTKTKQNKMLTISPSLLKEVQEKLKLYHGKFSALVETLLEEWLEDQVYIQEVWKKRQANKKEFLNQKEVGDKSV